MKNKRVVAVIAITAAAIATFAGWSILSQKPAAPDVTLVTLSGKPVALNQLRGKVVLVNFWATTCTTCVSEMPRMVELYKSLSPRGYDMVAVAMDYDRPDWVINFAQKNALPFTVALDIKGEAAQAFGGIRLTPTTFLIDKQGRIVQRFLGEPDFVKLKKKIEELLQPV